MIYILLFSIIVDRSLIDALMLNFFVRNKIYSWVWPIISYAIVYGTYGFAYTVIFDIFLRETILVLPLTN